QLLGVLVYLGMTVLGTADESLRDIVRIVGTVALVGLDVLAPLLGIVGSVLCCRVPPRSGGLVLLIVSLVLAGLSLTLGCILLSARPCCRSGSRARSEERSRLPPRSPWSCCPSWPGWWPGYSSCSFSGSWPTTSTRTLGATRHSRSSSPGCSCWCCRPSAWGC